MNTDALNWLEDYRSCLTGGSGQNWQQTATGAPRHMKHWWQWRDLRLRSRSERSTIVLDLPLQRVVSQRS
jgi:hypothetical protein